MPETKVTFLQAASSKEKVYKLLSIVTDYYENKKKLLLKTDSEAVVAYLDKLLWELPKESFLPHHTSPLESGFIYLSSQVPSDCYSIFNFTKKPVLEPTNLAKIYEFEDVSSQEKKRIFEDKYAIYSKASYHLISL